MAPDKEAYPYASRIVKLVDDNGDELASVHEAVLTKYEAFAKDLERQESAEDGDTKLVLPNISQETGQELVRWLYTGKLGNDYSEDMKIFCPWDGLEKLAQLLLVAGEKNMADLRACATDIVVDIVRFHKRQWSILTWLINISLLDSSTRAAVMRPIADAIRQIGWERYLAANKDVEDYLNSHASVAVELMALIADSQVLS
ncbi:hypothetical protein LTR93_010604 [Exophiala xenobiotica]|nr:hypothetical protein LTR93_010604 [Exophiala xenobiotica]